MCDVITTRSIVTDYFNYRLKSRTITPHPLFYIVRQIAQECEASYYSQQPTLNFQFSSSLNDLRDIHCEIAKELFNDAILAERVVQQHQEMNADFVFSSMIDWTTTFIDKDLQTWLQSQNAWAGCLKMYDKRPQRRNSISRYASILGTIGMLTLGALYMKRI